MKLSVEQVSTLLRYYLITHYSAVTSPHKRFADLIYMGLLNVQVMDNSEGCYIGTTELGKEHLKKHHLIKLVEYLGELGSRFDPYLSYMVPLVNSLEKEQLPPLLASEVPEVRKWARTRFEELESQQTL